MNRRQPQIKIQAFLANLPMFSEMSAEELDRIAAHTMPLHVEKGQTICHTGDPCTGFHVVVYGQAKLGFTSPQGVGNKWSRSCDRGQSFGEARMFTRQALSVMSLPQALVPTLICAARGGARSALSR